MTRTDDLLPPVVETGRLGEGRVTSFDFPNPWMAGIHEAVGRARMRQHRRWRRRGTRINRRRHASHH